jgi:hypothetical protein
VGGLHLVAALAGIATKIAPGHAVLRVFLRLLRGGARRAIAVRLELPGWLMPGVRAGGRALVRLLSGGLAVTVIALLVHGSRLGDTYGNAGNFGGVLGLTLLSLAYLPNVVIGAAAVLVGAGVHIGAGALSVSSVVGAPVPGLPVLAAVPVGPARGWWPVLLLIPAAIGVFTGLDCARTSADRARAPWATVTAAGLVAVATAVLGPLAGGAVGSFGDIGPDLMAPVLAGGWVAVAGYAGLLYARRFRPAGAGLEFAGADGYGGVDGYGGADEYRGADAYHGADGRDEDYDVGDDYYAEGDEYYADADEYYADEYEDGADGRGGRYDENPHGHHDDGYDGAGYEDDEDPRG